MIKRNTGAKLLSLMALAKPLLVIYIENHFGTKPFQEK